MGVFLIGKAKPDWNRIKTEYKTGSCSLRDLSEKYHVSWSTIRQRAFREKWGDERRKTQAKIEQDVIRRKTEKSVDVATLASEVRLKGLIILSGLLDEFCDVRSTEHRVNKKGVTDIKRLRDLTGAFKDLTSDVEKPEAFDNPILKSLFDIMNDKENNDE